MNPFILNTEWCFSIFKAVTLCDTCRSTTHLANTRKCYSRVMTIHIEAYTCLNRPTCFHYTFYYYTVTCTVTVVVFTVPWTKSICWISASLMQPASWRWTFWICGAVGGQSRPQRRWTSVWWSDCRCRAVCHNMAAQIEDILVVQHLSDHHQHSWKAACVLYAVNVHQALNSLLSWLDYGDCSCLALCVSPPEGHVHELVRSQRALSLHPSFNACLGGLLHQADGTRQLRLGCRWC